jgi:Kef-type K+ transport system membrane component KefB
MTPFLQLALALAIIILAAKLGGYISYRLGQPSVLGELLVGIILGPTLFDMLHLRYFSDENLDEVVHELAEIGVLLLMFIAGLGLHISDLAKSGKVSTLGGVLGVVAPLLLGAGAGLAFSMPLQSAIFVGLILSATSVSISAQTLIEMKALRTRVGIGLLGAAVFDDILVVLGLSVFIALGAANPAVGGESGAGNGWLEVLVITGKMVFFLLLASAIGRWVLPRLSEKFYELPISQGLMAFTFVIVLLYGWMAEVIGGMAAITGAFLAGLWLSRSALRERILSAVSVVAYGVFVPIFFVDVGLTANGRMLGGENLWLLVVMIIIAVVSKVAGAGLGARLAGFSWIESLQFGVGMMSRGEVGLIVASVGISEGLISQGTFAAVVGVVIVTTLLTPPLLRMLFNRPEAVVAAKEGGKV